MKCIGGGLRNREKAKRGNLGDWIKNKMNRYILYFAMYNALPCVIHTHVFGLDFQEKNLSF